MHENRLASYALREETSQGRLLEENFEKGVFASCFMEDKERILYSRAFRRLGYKTQVFFTKDSGDHYRTRLTHTLEVAHTARFLAQQCGVNEELAEAIALAHDLGHPPFGHCGERALAMCLRPYGGFDHNVQTIRLVTSFERISPYFRGLNLTFETLEGLLKHNGPLSSGTPLFLYAEDMGISPSGYGTLEAQIASLSDDVSYYAHDFDDGLRAGFFTWEDLLEVEGIKTLFAPIRNSLKENASVSAQDGNALIWRIVKHLMVCMRWDLVYETVKNLQQARIETVSDIRACNEALVSFSPDMGYALKHLRRFLYENVWRRPEIFALEEKAVEILHDLFVRYLQNPSLLPQEWYREYQDFQGKESVQAISDFIAGMTDRYALEQYDLFNLNSG